MRRAYRLGEISAMIGVPVSTLRLWCERGELPNFKVGKTYFVTRDYVERAWQI
jgi:excisionase family DNA binding protein